MSKPDPPGWHTTEDGGLVNVHAPDGRHVATIEGHTPGPITAQERADAEHICRCLNAHAALLLACELAHSVLSLGGSMDHGGARLALRRALELAGREAKS